MAIGLKRGFVELADHDAEWEILAADTIQRLWRVFGSTGKDIQHVGSTAIRKIKAKPVIDIVVAVEDFDEVLAISPALEENGFIFRGWEGKDKGRQPVFQCGEYVPGEKDMRLLTHYIHIVMAGSKQWHNYVNFRDYMSACPAAAYEYEALKLRLADENKNGGSLHNYHIGKQNHVTKMIEIACMWDDLGRRFAKIEFINKGASPDKKYYIETTDRERLLLRVADIAEYDRKKAEYGMMKRVYELGVLTPKPIEFGLCDNGKNVYSLSGWMDGEDVETALPHMSEAEQYSVGLKAGEILRKIHTLPAPDDAEPWGVRFRLKVQKRVDLYNTHNLKSENGEKIIKYLADRQYLLDGRPQTFWHGDFNVGNHMIMSDGQIGTIDYNYWNLDHGDPWWEFVLIPWGKEPPAHYFTGIINGYFNNVPPCEFFNMLSYYFACDALSALCYTFLGTEPCEPEDGRRHMENILRWFDNMKNPVPTWYLKEWRTVK